MLLHANLNPLGAFWPLFVIAVIGTLNPSAGDVSLFLPVEQAALADTVAAGDLTAIFSRYNVAGALTGAIGALASALTWRPMVADMALRATRRSSTVILLSTSSNANLAAASVSGVMPRPIVAPTFVK